MSQSPLSPPLPTVYPLARWSLIIGVAALVLSWIPVAGLILGLVAIVLGAIALTRADNKAKPAVGLALGIAAVLVNAGALSSSDAPTRTHAEVAAVRPIVASPAAPAASASASAEQQNAVRSARGYLQFSAFSRKGLINQLSSEAGDGYSVEAATYAVDSLDIDFNEQAYKSAKNYLAMSGFSRANLIAQLESDAGEGFTHSQAVYGVTKAGL
jgi:hypothetical protein